jgi:hypothetical protein
MSAADFVISFDASTKCGDTLVFLAPAYPPACVETTVADCEAAADAFQITESKLTGDSSLPAYQIALDGRTMLCECLEAMDKSSCGRDETMAINENHNTACFNLPQYPECIDVNDIPGSLCRNPSCSAAFVEFLWTNENLGKTLTWMDNLAPYRAAVSQQICMGEAAIFAAGNTDCIYDQNHVTKDLVENYLEIVITADTFYYPSRCDDRVIIRRVVADAAPAEIARSVEINGYLYATIDFVSPTDCSVSCQSGPAPIPLHWELALASDDVATAVASACWGSEYLTTPTTGYVTAFGVDTRNPYARNRNAWRRKPATTTSRTALTQVAPNANFEQFMVVARNLNCAGLQSLDTGTCDASVLSSESGDALGLITSWCDGVWYSTRTVSPFCANYGAMHADCGPDSSLACDGLRACWMNSQTGWHYDGLAGTPTTSQFDPEEYDGECWGHVQACMEDSACSSIMPEDTPPGDYTGPCTENSLCNALLVCAAPPPPPPALPPTCTNFDWAMSAAGDVCYGMPQFVEDLAGGPDCSDYLNYGNRDLEMSSYQQNVDYCYSSGARLCTYDEINNDPASVLPGPGCSGKWQWAAPFDFATIGGLWAGEDGAPGGGFSSCTDAAGTDGAWYAGFGCTQAQYSTGGGCSDCDSHDRVMVCCMDEPYAGPYEPPAIGGDGGDDGGGPETGR